MKNRYSRQGFLGDVGQAAIETARVCIVGLGGGGSIIAPQLAHVGVQAFVLFDADRGDETNLNRTMTLTEADIAAATLKVEAAKRRILEVNARADIKTYACRWQDEPDIIRGSDLVLGSVNTYSDRQQLEACCRRYVIPYIDIGMDIYEAQEGPPGMGGQVILSMPGHACMFCMGFLTDEKLGREANNYGAAGARPQVIWANGVLALTAVGIAVDLLTDWTRALRGPVYDSFRGNDGTLTPHVRLPHIPAACVHYPSSQTGGPRFRDH